MTVETALRTSSSRPPCADEEMVSRQPFAQNRRWEGKCRRAIAGPRIGELHYGDDVGIRSVCRSRTNEACDIISSRGDAEAHAVRCEAKAEKVVSRRPHF